MTWMCRKGCHTKKNFWVKRDDECDAVIVNFFEDSNQDLDDANDSSTHVEDVDHGEPYCSICRGSVDWIAHSETKYIVILVDAPQICREHPDLLMLEVDGAFQLWAMSLQEACKTSAERGLELDSLSVTDRHPTMLKRFGMDTLGFPEGLFVAMHELLEGDTDYLELTEAEGQLVKAMEEPFEVEYMLANADTGAVSWTFRLKHDDHSLFESRNVDWDAIWCERRKRA